MVVGAKIKENQKSFYRRLVRLRQENCFGNCRKKGFNFCCLILKSAAKPWRDSRNIESSSVLVATRREYLQPKAWRIIFNMLLC